MFLLRVSCTVWWLGGRFVHLVCSFYFGHARTLVYMYVIYYRYAFYFMECPPKRYQCTQSYSKNVHPSNYYDKLLTSGEAGQIVPRQYRPKIVRKLCQFV